MSSQVRRMASKLLALLERAADPGPEADQVRVYARDVGGVGQLFAQVDDGEVYQLTPNRTMGFEILPEQWFQALVPAGQAPTPMGTRVSQLFPDFRAIRRGSIVGMEIRFDAPIVAGTATATVTRNGGATGVFSVLNPGVQATSVVMLPGLEPYIGGAVLGITLETSAGFLPSGVLSCEAAIEVQADPTAV